MRTFPGDDPSSRPALLIENVETFSPNSIGNRSLLALHGKIARLAPTLDRSALDRLGVAYEVLESRDCLLLPGFVDPHAHLSGGSGERGFSTQTPAIRIEEIVESGITTIVGCIGVDTLTQNVANLFGKVAGLNEEGISAFLYTGGYDVPPSTLTGDPRRDLILVREVIGIGETAIADLRGTQPTDAEIARLVAAGRNGRLLAGKSGVTHFHVGDAKTGIEVLNRLLDREQAEPDCLYPTHVERNPWLLEQAAAITHRGVPVDMDICDGCTVDHLRTFTSHGGIWERLTLSSDASIVPPKMLFDEWKNCVRTGEWKFEALLSLVTSNAANILRLPGKGRLREGGDADFILVDRQSLDLRTVVANGRVLLRDGALAFAPRWKDGSPR